MCMPPPPSVYQPCTVWSVMGVSVCAGALGVSQPVSYQEMLSHLQGAVSVLSSTVASLHCVLHVYMQLHPSTRHGVHHTHINSPTCPPSPHCMHHHMFRLCLCSEKGARPVTFSDWEKINQREVDQGTSKGKPREKVVQTQEMFDIIDRK